MNDKMLKAAEDLFSSPLYYYADWPNSEVPAGPGVYAVWEEEELVWVGSAGGSMRSRLERHVKGQRRGSEFLTAVYARLMFRKMGLEKAMQTAGETQLLVDAITGKYVKNNLSYRCLQTADENAAEEIAEIIAAGLASQGKPFLNSG